MDMRIEDNREEIVAQERQAQERKSAQKVGNEFKKAMIDAQTSSHLGKDRLANKHLKDAQTQTSDLKGRDRKTGSLSGEGRRFDAESSDVKIDDILNALQGEETSAFERRSDQSRDRRVEREEKDETSSSDESSAPEQEKPSDSVHELDRAVVFGGTGGDRGGGADTSGGDQEERQDHSEDVEALQSVDGDKKSRSLTKAALSPAVETSAPARGGSSAMPVSETTFNAALQKRLSHKIPESLLRNIVSSCQVMVNSDGEGLELALSRHLFEGMKIRIHKDKDGQLSLELSTHSQSVAEFFESERSVFVAELQKRGLAVSLNRVTVTLHGKTALSTLSV